MTFWLDAHLDPTLALWISSNFGVATKHLQEAGLLQAEDQEIFDAARRFGNIAIVTKDWDFIDLVTRLGPPPQILRLGMSNMPTISLQSILRTRLRPAIELLQQGEAWVEIV
jgi:predicted nuclease of predicted toxin-antitoxin system